MTIEQAAEAIAAQTPELYAFRHNVLMIGTIILMVSCLIRKRLMNKFKKYGLNLRTLRKLDRIGKIEGIPSEQIIAEMIIDYIDNYERNQKKDEKPPSYEEWKAARQQEQGSDGSA